MKKLIAILSLVSISSTVFASSEECVSQLDSILYHTSEATRLDAAAIQHGLNIYTGEIVQIDKFSKAVPSYIEIANAHRDAVNKIKSEFKKNCLK